MIKLVRFLTILLNVIIFTFNIYTYAQNNNIYPNTDITRLDFKMTGNPIIYSDYPETIYEENYIINGKPIDKKACLNQIGLIDGNFYGIGRHFNKVKIQAGKTYTAEFYNGRGSAKNTGYLFAIAFLYESNSNDIATITINKSGQQNTERVTSLLTMSLQAQNIFFNSSIDKQSSLSSEFSKPRQITLNAHEGKIAIYEEIKSDIGYANGKIQFTSDKDVTLLQFYVLSDVIKEELKKSNLDNLNQDNLDNLNLYYTINEISKEENRVKKLEEFPKLYTTTTAVLNYDTREATVDASVGTKFYLSNAGHINSIRDFNINEYEPFNENDYGGYPYNNVRIHDGNYSIIYSIKLNGVTGKKIKITPYREKGKSISSGVILYNSVYGFWYYPKPNQDYWIMPVPDDGEFKFVLPGSVYGDILFEVVEPSEVNILFPDETYDNWAKEDIKKAISLNLVPTELQNNYKNNITRQEFCKIALQLYLVKINKTFDEVVQENNINLDSNIFVDTSDKNILLASHLDIVKGVGNNKFSPNKEITRQESAVMLNNLFNILNINVNMENKDLYADNNDIAEWAKESVYKMSSIKLKDSNYAILNGVGNNKFLPLNYYTRQESICTIIRLFNI